MRVGVLTISDSAAAGTREDQSGPAVANCCVTRGWTVAAVKIIADAFDTIATQLVSWADSGFVDLILTTGGTGLSARDVTPDATACVIERTVPGIGEVMRFEGRKQTHFAPLSRALAGTRGEVLIVNLPGSPRGAAESLESVAELFEHAVQLLRGNTEHK